uniref:Uncharacterized protein n=1 Tax=Peronospora matthiolae TaxID=2874970 RepID=A0AAV1VI90_9STRA
MVHVREHQALAPSAPLRKPRQSRPSRNPPPNPKVSTERENGNSQ